MKLGKVKWVVNVLIQLRDKYKYLHCYKKQLITGMFYRGNQ